MIPAGRLGRFAVPQGAIPRSIIRRVPRFQSTTSSSSSTASKTSSGRSHLEAIAAGAAGGVAGAAFLYGIYSFTPAGRTAGKLNKAAAEADKKYQIVAQKLQQNTPNADQAVDAIRQFAYSYVAWIPGGRAYVDTAFHDWESVRESHKNEADKIINDAYKQLQDASKSGLSLETASKAYDILAEMSKKIAGLSANALTDILDNHPSLKEKLGGGIEQLQDIGNNYGPEATKQVDETWSKVKDILTGGLTAENIEKSRKLVAEKVSQLKELGEKAWEKGLEEAKPYLDKNPKAQELIEKNADTLKQGNMGELFNKLRSAVDSDNLDDLRIYIGSVVDMAKSKGSEAAGGLGLEKYLDMIPQGDEVVSKLQQILHLADKHKGEGEELVKETAEALQRVLEEKSRKARDMVERARKETK